MGNEKSARIKLILNRFKRDYKNSLESQESFLRSLDSFAKIEGLDLSVSFKGRDVKISAKHLNKIICNADEA